MKKLICLGILAGLIASPAYSGGMSTGGGTTIVCRDSNRNIVSAQMLDLYEGRIRFQLAIPQSSGDPNEQLGIAISRIQDDFLRTLVTEFAAKVINHIRFFPPNVVLAPGSDLGNSYGVVIPDGCELAAVGFYEQDGTLRVSQKIYQTFSATDQAAFILHEAIYKLARDTSGDTSSEASRMVTAELFASNIGADKVNRDLSSILFSKYCRVPSDQCRLWVSAVLPSSDTEFEVRITPLVPNAQVDVRVLCQKWDDIRYDNRKDWQGRGPITLWIRDAECNQVVVWAKGAGPAPWSEMEVEILSGHRLLYSGTSKTPSWLPHELELTRSTQLPPLPAVP